MTVVAQVTGALGTEGMGILCSDIENDILEALEKVQARLSWQILDLTLTPSRI